MRVLLIGTLLGALLGLCSFWLLGSIDWLTPPQKLVGASVLGLAFAGLVWSFGLVRWVARRLDRRARRKPTVNVDGESAELVDVELDEDELTGPADDTWLMPAVEVPDSPPPREPTDHGAFGLYDEEEDFDESTTQLVSRSELKALARALLDGKRVPEPTQHLSPHEIEELLASARFAVEEGRFDDALDLFTQIIDGAEDVRAYLGRGRVHLDHSDFNRAMSDFAVAEDLMPGAPEPLLAMGDLFFGRKDYAQSIEYLTLALEQQPDNAMALTRRGMSLYYRKDYEAALADLRRAAELDPDIPMLASYLARVERRVRATSTISQDRRRR
ncbi:MAG: tetratricopeptide repeat protein [Myxococcota bacterium]